MTDNLIHVEISDIVSRLRWLESRDGTVCHETRYNAMCKALGLLNRVSEPSQFTRTRRALFSVMNEAKTALRS
jgi:hypothetical protein